MKSQTINIITTILGILCIIAGIVLFFTEFRDAIGSIVLFVFGGILIYVKNKKFIELTKKYLKLK